MNIDVKICFAYKNNKEQAGYFKICNELVKGVISSLIEQGRSGSKSEFSNLSGKIKTCSGLHESDFIIGDPSHPNFHATHDSESNHSLRPVPSVILLPDYIWSGDVNSILKNPLYDIRGIFRASKLNDAEELGRFSEAIKALVCQILRRERLSEENFSKRADWKVKISEGCEMEFTSLFSTPAMQRMSAKYKDALLALDDDFLRGLRENSGASANLEECCRKIRNFFGGRDSYHVPSLLILCETG